MKQRQELNIKKLRRQRRTRAKIHGAAAKPRLSVFRSNKEIEGQLINDAEGKTLVHISSRHLDKVAKKKTKVEQAALVGEMLSKKAQELGIKQAILDRGSYRYHGRVRALAEGARKGGLAF